MPNRLARWLNYPGRLLRKPTGQLAHTIVNNTNEGIWLLDEQDITTFVNPCLAEMLGYRPEEMLGRSALEFLFPEDIELAREKLAQRREGTRERTQFRLRHKDGSELWVYASANGIRREGGSYFGLVCMISDITERKRMESALEQSEAKYRRLVETSGDLIWELDAQGRYRFLNEAVRSVLGYDPKKMLGRSFTEFQPPQDAQCGLEEFFRVRSGEARFDLEMVFLHRDGTPVDLKVNAVPVVDEHGTVIGTTGTATDISEYKKALRMLAQEREQAQVTLESIADGVLTTDAAGLVTYLNPAAEGITGWSRAEAIGQSIDEIVQLIDEASGQLICSPWRHVREDSAVALPKEHPLRRRDDSRLPIEGSLSPLRDGAGRFLGSVMVLRDVSATHALAAQLSHQATHDALTGLPNRALLLDRLDQAIAHAKRHQSRLALLYLDLDRFKHINDTLGHTVGDELLRQVSRRLEASVRRTDTVSRQGGDEFIVLLADSAQPEHLTQMAEQLVREIAAPYYLDSHELHLSTSIGISVYPEDGVSAATLIKHADIAMYHAKERGRNNFQFFTPTMNQRAAERLFLENHLRQALERGELELHYQPQIHLISGRIVSAEALLRWRHSKHGPIPPSRFIPVAEDSGLILAGAIPLAHPQGDHRYCCRLVLCFFTKNPMGHKRCSPDHSQAKCSSVAFLCGGRSRLP